MVLYYFIDERGVFQGLASLRASPAELEQQAGVLQEEKTNS
jgi:hypothetical protein